MDPYFSHHDILMAASIALGSAAYIIYLHGMWRRKIMPHAFSWLVGALMTWIAFAAQVADGAGPGMWTNLFTALMCSIIGALALPYGERNITRSDWIALIACGFAILLWALTNDPTWSVILVVAIDIFSVYPTIRKTYHKPYEESALTAGLNGLKFVCGFFALENYSIASALYLASNVVLIGGLCVFILWRRWQLR